MSDKVLINTGHEPGNACLAFTRDGSRVYTGSYSAPVVRLWRMDQGADVEPDAITMDGTEGGVTCLATGGAFWLSGNEDGIVRQHFDENIAEPAQITEAVGSPILSVTVNPEGNRVAVTSGDTWIKVIDLEDTTSVSILRGHSKPVRSVTWHPSGSLLTSCGSDGKIIVWDVSEADPTEVKVIEGVIPAVADTESPEFAHECAAIWHTSGQHFFVATRAHEIVTISRSDWSKSSTFSDEASSGAITALGMSKNGVYLASASKSGVFIWSTQTRRLLFRFQSSQTAVITKMAFSPSENMLAWTDMAGVFTRWLEPIPKSSPDPVKLHNGAASTTLPVKRPRTPTLFDRDADEANNIADVDLDEDIADVDNEDWILDDLGGGLEDDSEPKTWGLKDGVKEMVSVTRAQPPFQPGATPMENRKRYLTYNMIGVIEVTDQDTHHVVNVEFHDRSVRKGYHFTDRHKYDLASLGERGALYACPPENDHLAHVMYKPYNTWASQGEWTFDLPKGTKVLGVAAGGPPPTKSLREKSDADIQGNGNVVIATSDNELIFLTGGGVEKHSLSLQGDFVSMVAGPEWVFVISRDGSTTMDGSQNLTSRLIKFEDFCLQQKDSLPIPKGHTLKWVGITEEGAPAIYDSTGVLNIMPRYRIPFSATWARVLNTNVLDRRQGKQESYWPVGVSGETFMCLILKGRQEHPGFPRPLIQELPLRLPFKGTDPIEGPLEEHLARETMLLDILRDGLGDELTTDDISRRELALDKELIKLIQNACKNDKLSRAVDLAKLLHHTASFDMAIRVAGFYHLIGLQEKFEALKDDREDTDRLTVALDKRRQRTRDLAPVPGARTYAEPSRPKPFQDFRPPPVMHRPGLERATPVDSPRNATLLTPTVDSQTTSTYDSFFTDESISADYSFSSSQGKRKRAEDDHPVRESRSPEAEDRPKRQAVGNVRQAVPQPRSNPFARKAGAETGRNPFVRSVDAHKVQKSDSFFQKVDVAETEPIKRVNKGKGKEKKETGRQTTLFGLPSVAPLVEKKAPGRNKKNVNEEEDSQEKTVPSDEVVSETQDIDITMTPSGETQTEVQDTQIETQADTEVSQVSIEIEQEMPGTPEPIEWPPSPGAD